MPTVTFEDTSHSLPSRSAERTGADVLERKIREAVDGEHKMERQQREREEEAERKKVQAERENAERGLGEFIGFEMWPTRHAEFEGASRHGQDCWEFRVGGLVFKLNRITSNVASNENGLRLKRRDYSFQVTTEFERVYGSRRLRDEARRRGEDECQKWEWHDIKSLADVDELRKAGKMEER